MYSIGKIPVIPAKVRELWKHVDAPPPSLIIALQPPIGKPGASTNYLGIGLTFSGLNHMNNRIEAENYYDQPKPNIIVLPGKDTQIRNNSHEASKFKKITPKAKPCK